MAIDDPVLAATRDVARSMLPELPEIGLGTAEQIASVMPEFAQPQVGQLLLAACQANSSALLDALMRGVPFDAFAPSAEALQTTRAFVRQRVGHDAVMRAYQAGTTYWCQRWADGVEHNGTDAELALRVVSRGTTFLLSWLQMITDRLSAEYRDESEHLAREGSMARIAEVQQTLTANDPDIVASSQRLGYDLRGQHVAIVLSRINGSQANLEATARSLAGTFTSARPLVVLVDVATAWCWVRTDSNRELPAQPDAILCGQGRPGIGLDGFRRTHREACEAVRVARLAGRPPGSVTRFDQVDLVSLCSADAAACRAFVTAELGGLAGDAPDAERLRETLRAFYASNSNFRATAAQLGLHHNTIRYRLSRAEALLGRPTDQRRLHLELALHLAELLDMPSPAQ